MYNAYEEEEEFKKHVKMVPIEDVPENPNVISSHALYKLKVEEEDLRLKSRIERHGNKDSFKFELGSDCAMCPPLGFHIVITVSSVNCCIIVRADVK